MLVVELFVHVDKSICILESGILLATILHFVKLQKKYMFCIILQIYFDILNDIILHPDKELVPLMHKNVKMQTKHYYDDPEFGRIIVTIKPGLKSFRAGWKDGVLNISCRPNITEYEFKSTLDALRDKIRKAHEKKHGAEFCFGQVIKCFDGYTITICPSDNPKQQVLGHRLNKDITISLPKDEPLDNINVKRAICKTIEHMIRDIAITSLIPLAQETAEQVGCNKVNRFLISHGKKTLGYCTRDRNIYLSSILMLYPKRLIRHIICHELAHIEHFDHSEAFHRLCDRYDGGREKEYIKELKTFKTAIAI